MLDINYIRDNADHVQKSAENKGYNLSIAELLQIDDNRRELQKKVDALRTERNLIAAEVKQSLGKPSEELLARGKHVKSELANLEAEYKSVQSDFDAIMRSIPNPAFEDVPLGGEDDSVEVKRHGGQPVGAIDHLDFATKHDWVDFERGAKAAGAKFYYLKGDLALLENAIMQFALNFLINKGAKFLTVPHMVNTRVAEGAGFAPKGDASGNEYFIEGEDLTLIGTAEAPLTGYHADEILEENDLPLFYVGYSPCYRKEAGTYGKHARGLFRVHQFNKLEMYMYCLPEQSRDMHEKILSLEEELWQAIGIPYRVVNIAAGDLGAPAAKKYDIEYWSPADEKYRELTSCSNCTDFQARNLNIRVRRKDGSIETAHTLNGTAVSLARSLVVILENFQNEDGTLAVPEVLQQYMQNRKYI